MVSIGLPFFNSEATLPSAIRSVFAQTWTSWELLLVDDGSTDGSRRIAEQVDDPRVRVLADDRNRGLPARLNEIAENATGALLARMDADDIMHPDRIARQVAHFDASPALDVSHSRCCGLDSKDRIVGIRPPLDVPLTPTGVLGRGGIIHPTVMARTAWFRSNPYRQDFPRAEDRELWARTFAASRIERLRDVIFFYRDVGTEASTRKAWRGYAQERRIMRLHGPDLVGRGTTSNLLAKSYAKSAGLLLTTATGLSRLRASRRYEPPTDTELLELESALADVRATLIPGLEAG